jgi:hypothetical protein
MRAGGARGATRRINLVRYFEIMIFDEYRQLRANTDVFVELPLHASSAAARERSDNAAVT